MKITNTTNLLLTKSSKKCLPRYIVIELYVSKWSKRDFVNELLLLDICTFIWSIINNPNKEYIMLNFILHSSVSFSSLWVKGERPWNLIQTQTLFPFLKLQASWAFPIRCLVESHNLLSRLHCTPTRCSKQVYHHTKNTIWNLLQGLISSRSGTLQTHHWTKWWSLLTNT